MPQNLSGVGQAGGPWQSGSRIHACLHEAPELTSPGTQLVYTSPGKVFTWLNTSAKHTKRIQRPSNTFLFFCELVPGLRVSTETRPRGDTPLITEATDRALKSFALTPCNGSPELQLCRDWQRAGGKLSSQVGVDILSHDPGSFLCFSCLQPVALNIRGLLGRGNCIGEAM